MHCPKCNIAVPSSYLKCPTCGFGFNGTNSASSFEGGFVAQGHTPVVDPKINVNFLDESIGGWLILPAIYLPIGILRLIGETYKIFSPLLNPGVWTALTAPDSAMYVPYFYLVAPLEILFNILLVAMGCYSAFLFYKKSQKAPSIIIYFYLTSAFGVLLDLFISSSLMSLTVTNKEIGSSVGGCISAIIWSLYFLRSKRVKRTFVKP